MIWRGKAWRPLLFALAAYGLFEMVMHLGGWANADADQAEAERRLLICRYACHDPNLALGFQCSSWPNDGYCWCFCPDGKQLRVFNPYGR